jgi:hypothetical protein
MANVIAHCQDVIDHPADYNGRGYQGDAWSFGASACGLAWQVTGNAAFAAAGIRLWRTLLADDQMMGDGLACSSTTVSAAQATQSIRHDTDYAIRFIGPHAALAYDWLHDAPGVDSGLLELSRFCFRQWIDFYTAEGYHHDEPASNYHAGYAAAKTFIAVAEGSEDGATSDRYWNETQGTLFAAQLIGDALAGAADPSLPAGALVGGDWPEGWQYGILSVTEYALAARALEEQGVPLPAMDQWMGTLMLHYFYALDPAREGIYVGGDFEASDINAPAPAGVLQAVLLGPSGDEAAGWARQALTALDPSAGDGAYDALAEVRAATPADFYATQPPVWYLARGTRTLFARSGWDPSAFWAVFTSAPRVVSDHQHVDATNFVLSRGADALIADPSPYGSRSSLTSNAVTVDSNVVLGEYKPSQTPWSKADLPWVRGTASGVVAARGDFAQAFIFSDTASDVPYALRDWVFLPEGEIVTLDRVRTDDPARRTYVRFRTPATLQLRIESGAWLATGDVGASTVAIHAVRLSGGTPAVRTPQTADGCDNAPTFGSCDFARFPVNEYHVEIPGPAALAVHVIDALGKGEAAAQVGSLNDPPYETAPAQNGAVVGVGLFRASKQTFVVASSAKDGAAGGSLDYGIPASNPSRHVVYDAPADAAGHATVTATAAGGRCQIHIAPGGTMAARPLLFSVGLALEGCTVTDDPDVRPGTVAPGSGIPANPARAPAAGCGCTSGGGAGAGGGLLFVLAFLATLARRPRCATSYFSIIEYAPQPGSPLIDAGDPQGGVGNDIGAVGAATANDADRFRLP